MSLRIIWLAVTTLVVTGLAATCAVRAQSPISETPAPNVEEGAEEPAKERQHKMEMLELAEGTLRTERPAAWKSIEPKVNIIECEFEIPATDPAATADQSEATDQANATGRLTGMLAGGGIEANIDRWVSQFKPSAGQEEQKLQHEELKVGELKVHWIRFGGTFSDRRGPFAPAKELDNYRLLGVIIDLEGDDYFLKLTAPAATADYWEPVLKKMIAGIQPAKK